MSAKPWKGDRIFKDADNVDQISFIAGLWTAAKSALTKLMSANGKQVIASVSWAVTAGAANICILTGTLKDADGATIAERRIIDAFLSTSSTGVGVSATSYSTGAAVSLGNLIATLAANKAFRVQTGADGIFAISITATGKPATEYAAAVLPLSGDVSVSAASSTHYG